MHSKTIISTAVESTAAVAPDMTLIRLRNVSEHPFPACSPGQFVEVGISTAKCLLNRPYSIFRAEGDTVSLLVKGVGEGSRALTGAAAGTAVTVIGPLGNPFSLSGKRPLLVGGGVGVAPIIYLARAYAQAGTRPTVVLGFRTRPDAFIYECLDGMCHLHVCTDDGSAGHHGLVTTCDAFRPEEYDIVQTCGPTPMMKAVAAAAASTGTYCEVSLENRMACGLGACLCCVQDTADGGRRCVCSEGPVFKASEIKW